MAKIGPEIVGRLFDEHAEALVLFARQRLPNPDDVVQDAFVKLARLPQTPENVVAWLYKVVRNGAIDAARRANRRLKRERYASIREAWFDSTDDSIDAQTATKLLDELDPDIREIVVARIWGGLTFDEIAQITGVSLATARRRYLEGLAELQERLNPKCSPMNLIDKHL